jgi:uncharacterized protein (TIGR02145 family)
VGDKCGINPQASYNLDLYECKPDVNPNGIFLKTPAYYQGESYEAVLIGQQVWLARNLNYNVEGSRCYGDNTGYDSQGNCATYGRLYDRETAIEICPPNWHLPSDAEWTALTNYVGSSAAGTKLKASSDLWSTNNGTDDYGFSALPGGYGTSSSGGASVGSIAFFLSSTQYGADAWYRSMSSNADVYRGRGSYLFSVRCVKD